MKLLMLTLLCFIALIAQVDNQNLVGAIQAIVLALKKLGFLPFVMNPDLIQNYNNSQGPVAFVYRQLLTQIPAFIANTLRDCLETELEALIRDQDALFSQFPLLLLDDNDQPYLSVGKVNRLGDDEGCPGISTIFPANSCLGRPTLSSDPGANVDKTSLIFVDDKGNDYIIKYDDFVLKKDTRRKALKRFFTENREVNVIVHGWTDHYYKHGWVWSFKEFILKNADPKPNILIVDWRQWSQSLAITKVKMNVYTVADQLATVLYMLTNEPYAIKRRTFNASNIYIYGHSYGSPIAGRGSEGFSELTNYSQRIAAILSLDPSDQCFGRGSYEGLGNRSSPHQEYSTLLEPSSAIYVKVIHTDSNAFGAYWRLGSVDIYVNQGSGQPDCPADPSSVTNVDSLFSLACSHYRATRIMTQAYYKQDGGTCQPVAFRCSSFDDFTSGVCACLFTDRNDATSFLVGSAGRCRQLAANRYETSAKGSLLTQYTGELNLNFSESYDTRDSWFLLMGPEPPFCPEIPNNVITTLKIDDNPEVVLDLSSQKQGILTISPNKVGRFRELIISYTDLPGELLGKQRIFHFQSLSLFYMSHVDYCIRSLFSRVYCAYNGEFGDEEGPASKVVSTREKFPGSTPTTEVKFTNGRCLDIVNHCADEFENNSTNSSPGCRAFVVGFLKDYILALHDQYCADDDHRCGQFLECIYALYNSNYGNLARRDNFFYRDIFAVIKSQDFDSFLYKIIQATSSEACERTNKTYAREVESRTNIGCQVRLFDPE
ncbi:Lipase member H [Halotydeus destructor]|nr:Lipase member H [Halotydeus destructor]